MANMKIDLRGRLQNTHLAQSHYLMPLLEAVVNSIQSIESANTSDGLIEIFVHRAFNQLQLSGESTLSEIIGFSIKDNGMGFNDANYESFGTADSMHKTAIGCKGIGRLLWLKAFSHAEVESHFLNDQNEMWVRSFSFAPTEKGIEDEKLEPSNKEKPETIINLVAYQKLYKDKCPRQLDSIAKRIIDHCIEYFILDTCPQIVLVDEQGSNRIDLGDRFAGTILKSVESSEFSIGEERFHINHLFLTPIENSQHHLVFCGHKRAVLNMNLKGKIYNLPNQFKDDNEKSIIYTGYVSSKYLDQRVGELRFGFNISQENSQEHLENTLFAELTWEDISKAALTATDNFLKPRTEPVKKESRARVELYVQNEPQYRPLLKYRSEEVNAIPPGLPEDKLDLELHKIYVKHEVALKARLQEVLTPDSSQTIDEMEEKINSFLQEWNETGAGVLANYISRRRATLELLHRAIKADEEGKYGLEKTIHSIVFPMRVTSQDVHLDNSNLWIIDERLAFHNYLSSDLRFTQMKEKINSDLTDRPDLLIFQTANALIETSAKEAVTIVEFKRPMRGEYQNGESPIEQVYDYIRTIRDGDWLDNEGRPIKPHDSTPFYAYIISDLTKKLRKLCEDAGFIKSPDGEGYFWFNNTHRCYIEVMSFSKLQEDAMKRNKILFQKLGIK